MKTIKAILLLSTLLVIMPLSAQSLSDWDISVEKYQGDEYIIKSSEFVYSIINKKYDLVKETTLDIEFDGESEKEFKQRRAGLRARILEIADSVFEFRNAPVEGSLLDMELFFDSRTKDYVGIRFIVGIKLKDYITVPKVQLLEKKMLQAGLNAGKTNLLDSNKYFVIDCGIVTGGKWRER